MNPVILFRGSLTEESEKLAAQKYFRVEEQRTDVPGNSLVIPRYSALPFYQELEYDMDNTFCKLINTYRQHCYVADLRNWYYDLGEYTPRTWFALDQIPDEGPFVLKGATNSKKHAFNTMMFAKDKQEAVEVHYRLSQDTWIGVQPIYVRQFVPLRKLAQGLNGLPISEEYRFFMLRDKVLSSGFYWSNYTEDLDRKYDPDVEVPKEFISKIASRVSPHINFWVVDVARTEAGDWVVVELNDGSQSGLSDNDPDILYKNLKEALKDFEL